MGNDQRPRCPSCIVTETHNFKIFPFLIHGYHNSQLKNIAISAVTLSPHNFTILPACQIEFFWVSNTTFLGDRNYVSVLITIISKINVLHCMKSVCIRSYSGS